MGTGDFPVVVGSGGLPTIAYPWVPQGNDGESSSFNGYSAAGGGGGGGQSPYEAFPGRDGGSGGGGECCCLQWQVHLA